MAREDNVVAALVSYLEKNLAKGYKIDELKWALISQKHSKIEIEKAIKIVQARTPSVKQEAPKEAKIEMVQESITVPEKKGFWSKIFG
jgi:hypothetical protein